MDERQRKQAELIIAHELDVAFRSTSAVAAQCFTGLGYRSIYGTVMAKNAVSNAVRPNSEKLLTNLKSQLSSICRSLECHDLLVAAVEQHFASMDGVVFDAACKASGRGLKEPNTTILQAGIHVFEQVKADLRAKLEIERFSFESPAELVAPGASPRVPIPVPFKNPGGKPLAEHWDALWAEIAFQLFSGALQPKRQADITKAMNDWLAERGFEAGDTAVTKRARALWQRMERG